MLASVTWFRPWNSAMRVCRGTWPCVAVEVNPRFPVSLLQPWHMKADVGRGSGWSYWWLAVLLFFFCFWYEWQPHHFSVFVIPATSLGFCCLQGLHLVSILYAFKLHFKTSLKPSWGRPLRLAPVARAPWSRSLGMRPSSILWTWPSQHRRRWRRNVNMNGIRVFRHLALPWNSKDRAKAPQMEHLGASVLVWSM